MGFIRPALMLLSVGAVVAGLLYVQNLQKDLENAIATNTGLEIANAAAQSAIEELESDYSRIQQQLSRVNTEFAEARAQNTQLRNRLSEHDLGMLAENRPESVERIINRATDNAGRCFEILSGSQLTEEEQNATSGNQFNRECPWLWPGRLGADDTDDARWLPWWRR